MEHDIDAYQCQVSDPVSAKSNDADMMVLCRIYRLTGLGYLLGHTDHLMQNVVMLSLSFLIKQACRKTLNIWKPAFAKLLERCRFRGLRLQRRFCIAVPI